MNLAFSLEALNKPDCRFATKTLHIVVLTTIAFWSVSLDNHLTKRANARGAGATPDRGATIMRNVYIVAAAVVLLFPAITAVADGPGFAGGIEDAAPAETFATLGTIPVDRMAPAETSGVVGGGESLFGLVFANFDGALALSGGRMIEGRLRGIDHIVALASNPADPGP